MCPLFEMTSTLPLRVMRALVRRRSSYFRQVMKNIAHGCILLALAVSSSACSRHRFPPNRGTQLFLVIHERAEYYTFVPIGEPEKYVVQRGTPAGNV